MALASRASILRKVGRRHGAFADFGSESSGGAVTGGGLCNVVACADAEWRPPAPP